MGTAAATADVLAFRRFSVKRTAFRRRRFLGATVFIDLEVGTDRFRRDLLGPALLSSLALVVAVVLPPLLLLLLLRSSSVCVSVPADDDEEELLSSPSSLPVSDSDRFNFFGRPPPRRPRSCSLRVAFLAPVSALLAALVGVTVRLPLDGAGELLQLALPLEWTPLSRERFFGRPRPGEEDALPFFCAFFSREGETPAEELEAAA